MQMPADENIIEFTLIKNCKGTLVNGNHSKPSKVSKIAGNRSVFYFVLFVIFSLSLTSRAVSFLV